MVSTVLSPFLLQRNNVSIQPAQQGSKLLRRLPYQVQESPTLSGLCSSNSRRSCIIAWGVVVQVYLRKQARPEMSRLVLLSGPRQIRKGFLPIPQAGLLHGPRMPNSILR